MKTARNILMALVLASTMSGCSSFWGGGAAGAVGSGAGYEYNAKRQSDKLDDDLKAGRIDKKEYEIRKNQIGRGSLVY